MPSFLNGQDSISPTYWIPTALYGALWLWLLVDCLRRKDWPATLGRGPMARVLWLLTFALLDPLLTLSYLAFIKRGLGGGHLWTRVTTVLAVLLSLVGFAEMFRTGGDQDFERGPDGAWGVEADVLSLRASAQMSASHASSSSGTANRPSAWMSPKHIEVFLTSDGPGSRLAAAYLVQGLQGISDVQKVTVRGPWSEPMRTEPIAMRIHLGLEADLSLPWLRAAPSSVVPWSSGWRFSTDLWEHGWAYHVPKAPTHSFYLETSGLRQLVALGIQLPSSKGSDIGPLRRALEDVVRMLRADLRWAPRAADLPKACYGVLQEPPALPFLEALQTRCLLREVRPLTHGKVVWTCTVPSRETLASVREQLEGMGYLSDVSGTDGDEPWLQVRRGPERVLLKPNRRGLDAVNISSGDGARETYLPPLADEAYTLVWWKDFSEAEERAASDAVFATGDRNLILAWSACDIAQDQARVLKEYGSVPAEHPVDCWLLANLARSLARSVGEDDSQVKELGVRWIQRAELWRRVGFDQIADSSLPTERLDMTAKGLGVDLAALEPILEDYRMAGFQVAPPTGEIRGRGALEDALGVVAVTEGGELEAKLLVWTAATETAPAALKVIGGGSEQLSPWTDGPLISDVTLGAETYPLQLKRVDGLPESRDSANGEAGAGSRSPQVEWVLRSPR